MDLSRRIWERTPGSRCSARVGPLVPSTTCLLIPLFQNGLVITPTAHQAHCIPSVLGWLSPQGLPVPKERKLPPTVQSLDTATRARDSCHTPCRTLDWESGSWCPPGLPRGLDPGLGTWPRTGRGQQDGIGQSQRAPRATAGAGKQRRPQLPKAAEPGGAPEGLRP